MNIYGQRASRHWREWLPEQYDVMDEPVILFEELGLWISDDIARIEFELLPPEYYRNEDFMTRVGHRGLARMRAEEMVLHVAMPSPDLADNNEDHLPDTWDAILEATVIDVDDVVLPRCTPR
ncbi:MAG: hypothetical protein ACR2LX_01545 [Jatrophihabitans sp.]